MSRKHLVEQLMNLRRYFDFDSFQKSNALHILIKFTNYLRVARIKYSRDITLCC